MAFVSHRGKILIILSILLCPGFPGQTQEIPPLEVPNPISDFARVMQFDSATRIEGRLLNFDAYDEGIWIEWTHWFRDGRWVPVKNDAQILLYPKNADMLQWFRSLKLGTSIRMIVRRDEDGKRRIIDLDET